MLFNSIEYLIFLPLVFAAYWLIGAQRRRAQNALLLGASYLFYGWWDWRFLLLILFTSLCSYASGRLIVAAPSRRAARWVSGLNIGINLAVLGVFKYYNFFASELAQLLGLAGDQWVLRGLVLPVGISFYTFQALSYSIDVYRGRIRPTRDVVAFLAYVAFFPQLVAGPIERATDLLPQFECERRFDYSRAVDGVRQMLWGFFKKIVVADGCARFVDDIFPSYASQSASTLVVAALLFAMQIYADFSGYSDIAIGTARLFGFSLRRNFANPYFSRDIAEFWRRWHISLTSWFRDYVYIPLGGSRVGRWRIVRNTFVIFLLSGLWHGANWTFLLWGAYHAALFLPLILTGRNRRHLGPVAEGRLLPTLHEAGQIVLTFVLATVGWIIFRSPDLPSLWGYLSHMADASLLTVPTLPMKALIPPVLMLVAEWTQRSREHALDLSTLRSRTVRYILYLLLLALIFLLGTQRQTFIYFQF